MKPDWILRLEARQVDDPASGIHLLAQFIVNYARAKAKECGYELVIEDLGHAAVEESLSPRPRARLPECLIGQELIHLGNEAIRLGDIPGP